MGLFNNRKTVGGVPTEKYFIITEQIMRDLIEKWEESDDVVAYLLSKTMQVENMTTAEGIRRKIIRQRKQMEEDRRAAEDRGEL
jgi:hypothetical protein